MKQFWCLLAAVLAAFGVRAEQVVFSEIMYHPPGTRPEYIEIYNNTATPFDIAEWKLRGGVDYDFPPFAPGNPTRTFLKPFERILLSPVDEGTLRAAYNIPANIRVYGPWTGNLNNAGERIRIEDKNGVTVCTVEYDDRDLWPVAADGGGHTLVLKNPDRKIDDWRNWIASAQRLGTPGTEPIIQAETPVASPEVNLSAGIPFVNYGDVWKYHDQNQDLGTNWRGSAFDDSAWPQGPGLLGFETAPLPAPGIRTAWADFNQLTYYARTRFVYNGSLSNVTVTIDQVLDDGAVYYLNGAELGRSGVGAGTVLFTTVANRTVSEAVEELGVITRSASAAGLVTGTNVLAVEVHQINNTSSDVVFGARLNISVPSQPSVVINEVLPGATGAGFVEIYNPGASAINLRNHYFTDDPGNLQKFRLDADVIVAAGGLASVGFAEVGLAMANPVKVYLVATNGASVINAISTTVPLDGRSIGRKPVGGSSWFLFVDPTRNAPNASQSSLAAELRLNEIHFAANDTVDWVEFHNTSGSAIPLSGLFLSANSDFSDKVALSGTVPAGGYASQDFALPSPSGQVTLFLINSSDTVLAARVFERSALGDTLQAFPNGSGEWYASSVSSRNAANNPARNTNVVINEIMYDPPSDERSGEFIELYNRGTTPVDVSGWRLADGVSFTIPPGTVLAPDGYLVVAADLAYMQSAYGAIPVIGNFDGQLGNNGEVLRLEDQWGNLVDEVDYLPGGNWPNLSNGDGSSMELRNPWMENGLPSAWADSNETNKAPFQHYTYSDVYRQLRADGGVTDHKELHLHLVGDSHVILQNIQLRLNGAGANLIPNGHQMSTTGSSAAGWLAQGTHYASYISPSSSQLNLIADGHGDNRANRLEIDATGMNANSTYEISFDARWVAGTPRLVVQTWDHSIATSIALPVPANLGSPGARNSRFIPLPGPQVDSILHSPPVPSAGQAVRVTARITSPGASALPSSQVLLFHRLDNANGDAVWASKAMSDNGTAGDEVAGDGIYSAQLTEYGVNAQIVQFYVIAQANSQSSQLPPGGRDRPAMYVVDTPSGASDLRKMRFVVSAFDLRDISEQDSPTGSHGYSFPRLSNHYYNMTAIINEKDIVYGCEVRNSGSPWTRGGSLDRGKFKFPKDKLFRGKVKLSYDNDAGGGSRHHNRIHRYWLYLFGHPANENEYFLVEVNAGGNALREEVEPPGNDMLDRIYENGSMGELYRIDDEWWFQDNWGRAQRDADWSYKGTDNAGRYRTEWMKRSRENEDDHTALVNLFKTISAGTYTQAQIESLVDPFATMIMSAVRGYTYDWDSFSLNRGKNGYMYRRSTDGKFMFFHWDSDLAFQDANNIFVNGMVGFRPYIQKAYNFRLYKHYLASLVENYARNSPRMNAWLQAEEDASSQYTVSTAYQNWFTAREAPAFTHLGASRTTAFDITSNSGNPITVSSNTINLAGTAPLRVFRVEAVGHPEAVFTWVTENTWTLTGIVLRTGANVLTLNAVNYDGIVVHTDNITVTKNGNAPPVMALEADPKSWHVSVVEPLELDARGSYDPDGLPLAFTWSVNPPEVQLDASQGDRATAIFSHPGLYTFTVTGQDAGGASANIQRQAAVYSPEGFSPFNNPALEPFWSLNNVVLRRNHNAGPYYSVTEMAGQLVLQVLDDRAFPLNLVPAPYPLISRPLPALTDWAFLSKVTPRAQVLGDYMAGVLVEMNEGGSLVRYAFGIEDGTVLNVRRITAAGTVSLLRSMALSNYEPEIRIRRAGNSLFFEQQLNDVWISVHSAGLPAGSAAVKAGLFLATDVRQTIKVAFDYAILIDPSATSDLRQSLRISELMYNPAGGGDYEFVELVNIGNTVLDLTGVQFVNGITYTFGSTTLGPRQYIVVPKNEAVFATRYDVSGINVAPGGYLGQLNNGGETVTLADSNGVVIVTVTYGVSGDWPTEADGAGSSLEVRDTFGNLNNPDNWRASPEANGSPGRPGGDALGSVIVNEVLTHTDLPFEDALEVFNRTAQPIDISGWFLSDSKANFKKYRIPDGTIVPAYGFHVFYEVDFNDTNKALVPFSFSSVNGDQAYISAADAAGNLTGYRSGADFEAAFNGVSFGRYETSVGRDFTAMTQRTFGEDNATTVEQFRSGTGLLNAAPLVAPVVISELMYHPPDIGTNENTRDEFIELFNVTSNTVPLYDPAFPTNTWHLRGGADFNFPTNVTLPAHGYLLVVSFDPATNAAALAGFRAAYGLPVAVPIYGPYEGRLSNGGEDVKLNRPDTPQPPGTPDEGIVPRVLADLVIYGDGYPWAASADGDGDSLQRRRPHEYGNDPVNWKGAAPSPGRANVAGAGFADFDSDGMPDSYETANAFGTGDPSDAAQDADADGKSNYEEFLDGTNPRNASDRLNAPVISAQPQDRTAAVGGTASFSVTANGTAPLLYQWRFNGVALANATNATLVLANVQTSSAGEYAVVVRNAAGFVVSEGARLSLNQALAILAQPQSRIVAIGASATFSVFAVGTGPLSYQWRLDGTNIAGATAASFAVTDAQPSDSGNYSVVVSDNNGSLTSADATLSVLAPPTIAQQPQSQTVVAYSDVFFSVVAGGEGPFTYQWRVNGTDIPAATNSILGLPNVQPNQAGTYTVVVFNPVGSVLSSNAVLTLIIPATITEQPRSATVAPGSNVTFSVTATSSSPLRYQWRFNDEDIPGAINRLLTLTNVQEELAGNYLVVVSDDVGSVRSDVAVLRVVLPLAVVAHPRSVSVPVGGTATFSVEIRGIPAPYGFNWFGGPSSKGSNTLFTTKSFLTLTNVQPSDANFYRAIIRNVNGTVVSLTAQLTVLADFDSDGLPDAYEQTLGLSTNNAADALLDLDDDGVSNRDEYIADTNPTNATSYLWMELPLISTDATLLFPARSNKTYTVEYTDDVGAGPWLKLDDLVAWPTNHVRAVLDPNPAVHRVYRVVTPRQP